MRSSASLVALKGFCSVGINGSKAVDGATSADVSLSATEFLSDLLDHHPQFSILIPQLFELLLDVVASAFVVATAFWASPFWSAGFIAAGFIAAGFIAGRVLGISHLLGHFFFGHFFFGVPKILLDILGSAHQIECHIVHIGLL
jgi:hypothetical protein